MKTHNLVLRLLQITLVIAMMAPQVFVYAEERVADQAQLALASHQSTNDGFVVGDGAQSDFMIIRSGSNIEIYVQGVLAYSLDYASTKKITVNGSNHDDVLLVDFSQGNPIPSGGLFYNGFDNGSNGDSINLNGGFFDSVTYEFFNPTDGAIQLDGFVITFTGLEPIIDIAVATTLTVNGIPADNAITYDQYQGVLPCTSTTPCGRVSIDNFETISFLNKVNLVINGLAGSDTIDILNPTVPQNLTTITVNAGSGEDVINLLESPAGLGTINLDGDDGDDAFNVRPSTSANTVVIGGNHFFGDTLIVDPFSATAIDTGTAVEVTGFLDIQYSEIEKVFILPLTASPSVDVTCTGPYVPGQPFSCSYSVTNEGPNAAENLVLRTLWFDYEPTVTAFTWDNNWACSADLTCSRLASMPVSSTEPISIAYMLPSNAYLTDPDVDGSFDQCVDLAASNDPSDNSECFGPYAMTPEASLNVEISDFPDPAESDGNLWYEIMVRNYGPSDLPADRVEVTTILDARLVFLGASPGCAYSPPDTVTCVVPTELAATKIVNMPESPSDDSSTQPPQGAYSFLVMVKTPAYILLDPYLITSVSVDAPTLNPSIWTIGSDNDSEVTRVESYHLALLPLVFLP